MESRFTFIAKNSVCLILLGFFSGFIPVIEAEEPIRKGPLKNLPSKSGPHIEKIKAMKDNSWLELGVVPPDPVWGEAIGRAWCGRMPFAPDLHGAFLYGEGRHGATTIRKGKKYYNDDLFFYDVNANKWICVYPGMEVGTYNLTINEDGFEVNAKGNPVPVGIFVHSYCMLTYDTHRKLFAHLWSPSGYWRKHFPKRVELVTKNAHKLNGIGRQWSKIKQASPWMYDTRAGHWLRYKTKTQTPKMGHGSHLLYLSVEKKHFFLGGGGSYFFDSADNDWHKLKPGGPPPPQAMDAASCYDPKRNRVYIAMGSYPKKPATAPVENRVWAYDVKKNTWIDLKAAGELPPRPRPVSGCGITKMFYDSANDAVVFFALGPDPTGSLERRGIYAYDADKNEWTRVSKTYMGGGHCFYDSTLNAYFTYKARDSVGKGTMFVYRYKQIKKKK
jgi:hypothetical protein